MSNKTEPLDSRPMGTKWDHINRLITVLQSAQLEDGTGWSWIHNERCKHIKVSIDTRGHVVHIQDIDGKLITIEELESQHQPSQKYLL